MLCLIHRPRLPRSDQHPVSPAKGRGARERKSEMSRDNTYTSSTVNASILVAVCNTELFPRSTACCQSQGHAVQCSAAQRKSFCSPACGSMTANDFISSTLNPPPTPDPCTTHSNVPKSSHQPVTVALSRSRLLGRINRERVSTAAIWGKGFVYFVCSM